MIVVFLIFIGYTLTEFAFYVPSAAERIDPTTVRTEGSLFANPRVEKNGRECLLHLRAGAGIHLSTR